MNPCSSGCKSQRATRTMSSCCDATRPCTAPSGRHRTARRLPPARQVPRRVQWRRAQRARRLLQILAQLPLPQAAVVLPVAVAPAQWAPSSWRISSARCSHLQALRAMPLLCALDVAVAMLRVVDNAELCDAMQDVRLQWR